MINLALINSLTLSASPLFLMAASLAAQKKQRNNDFLDHTISFAIMEKIMSKAYVDYARLEKKYYNTLIKYNPKDLIQVYKQTVKSQRKLLESEIQSSMSDQNKLEKALNKYYDKLKKLNEDFDNKENLRAFLSFLEKGKLIEKTLYENLDNFHKPHLKKLFVLTEKKIGETTIKKFCKETMTLLQLQDKIAFHIEKKTRWHQILKHNYRITETLDRLKDRVKKVGKYAPKKYKISAV